MLPVPAEHVPRAIDAVTARTVICERPIDFALKFGEGGGSHADRAVRAERVAANGWPHCHAGPPLQSNKGANDEEEGEKEKEDF